MLLEILLAWLLSIGMLLGLFELTEQIVRVNDTVLRLSVTAAHLRGIEGHWRLALYHGVAPASGGPICKVQPEGLPLWCDQWQELLSGLAADGAIRVDEDAGQFVATVTIGFTSGFTSGSENNRYRLTHGWSEL